MQFCSCMGQSRKCYFTSSWCTCTARTGMLPLCWAAIPRMIKVARAVPMWLWIHHNSSPMQSRIRLQISFNKLYWRQDCPLENAFLPQANTLQQEQAILLQRWLMRWSSCGIWIAHLSRSLQRTESHQRCKQQQPHCWRFSLEPWLTWTNKWDPGSHWGLSLRYCYAPFFWSTPKCPTCMMRLRGQLRKFATKHAVRIHQDDPSAYCGIAACSCFAPKMSYEMLGGSMGLPMCHMQDVFASCACHGKQESCVQGWPTGILISWSTCSISLHRFMYLPACTSSISSN